MITLLTRIVGPATVELRHIAGAGTHLCRILNLASVTRTTRIATGVAHIVGEDAVRALQLSLADGSAVGLADILISIALAKDVATIDLTDHRHNGVIPRRANSSGQYAKGEIEADLCGRAHSSSLRRVEMSVDSGKASIYMKTVLNTQWL
jgi:hypothetical protein